MFCHRRLPFLQKVCIETRVVAAIFAYLSLLKHQGIQRHYFGEIAHALDQDFHFPVMTRNMDYIE